MSRFVFRVAALLLGTALFAMTGCNHASTARPTAKAPEPQPKNAAAPVELKILDYDGLLGLIEGHAGRVVVLDCWSTSCTPCRREFHNLVELHHEHGPDKVACVSLNLDFMGNGTPEECREPVIKFLREQAAAFDNILSSDSDEAIYEKLEFGAIPAVFVFDRQGKLAKRFDGEAAYKDVKAFVAAMLPEPAA